MLTVLVSLPSRDPGLQSSWVDPVPSVPRPLGHRLVARRAAVWHGVRGHPLRTRRGDPERTDLLQTKSLCRYQRELAGSLQNHFCDFLSWLTPRVFGHRVPAADWLVSDPAAVWPADPGADSPPPLGDGQRRTAGGWRRHHAPRHQCRLVLSTCLSAFSVRTAAFRIRSCSVGVRGSPELHLVHIRSSNPKNPQGCVKLVKSLPA